MNLLTRDMIRQIELFGFYLVQTASVRHHFGLGEGVSGQSLNAFGIAMAAGR